MKPREFYELAKEMRHAQKMYFSSKDKVVRLKWLVESKSLEERIDKEIDRVENILAKRKASERQTDAAVSLMERNGFTVVSETRNGITKPVLDLGIENGWTKRPEILEKAMKDSYTTIRDTKHDFYHIREIELPDKILRWKVDTSD